jgi:peptidoglycan/LPS O-acetylase OafA/YrhL
MSTVVVVLLAHAVAGFGGVFDKINGLTPQFLALFALGAFAVWLGGGERAATLRRPLAAVALVAIGSFVVLAIVEGSAWMVAQFFWMDLLFGVGVACLLAVIYAGGFVPGRRVLASRPALWLGLFSYSIYLIHDPILGVLDKYAFGPMDLSPLATFGVTLAVGLPLILMLCYGFHLLFEAPFLRHRGWEAFRTMPLVRVWRRDAAPIAASPDESTGPAIVGAPQPATAERTAV